MLSIFSPDYAEYVIKTRVKEQIISQKSPKLEQYTAVIAEFAETLDKNLGKF